jgi:hypothetical protein
MKVFRAWWEAEGDGLFCGGSAGGDFFCITLTRL